MSIRSWVFSAVNSILQEWQPNDYDACKFSKLSMQNIPVKDKLSQLDKIFIMLEEFSKKISKEINARVSENNFSYHIKVDITPNVTSSDQLGEGETGKTWKSSEWHDHYSRKPVQSSDKIFCDNKWITN